MLRDSSDATQLRLLYANSTPEDILLRQELDSLAEQHPNKLRVWYTGKAGPSRSLDIRAKQLVLGERQNIEAGRCATPCAPAAFLSDG